MYFNWKYFQNISKIPVKRKIILKALSKFCKYFLYILHKTSSLNTKNADEFTPAPVPKYWDRKLHLHSFKAFSIF